MDTENEAGMRLAISFPDQSHSFVHGYEAGKLASRMEAGEQEIDCGCDEGFPMHDENLEVARRMSAYHGYDMEHRRSDHGWAFVRFTKDAKPKPRLQVVK